MLAEYDDGDNLLAEYVYANGQRVAKLTSGSGTAIYLNDHLGSARVLYGTGWSANYYPFGEVASQTGSDSDTRYDFTGQERDAGKVFLYFGARYYDPEIGRWLSVDPLRNDRPWESSYTYTGNNPIIRYDPDGQFWGAIFGAGVEYGIQVLKNLSQGKPLNQALTQFDRNSIMVSAVAGVFSGGLSSLVTGYKAGRAISMVGNVAINVTEGQVKNIANGKGLSGMDATVDAGLGVLSSVLGDLVQGQVKNVFESWVKKASEAGEALTKAERKLAGTRMNSKASRQTYRKNQANVSQAQQKFVEASKKAYTAMTLQSIGADNAIGTATGSAVKISIKELVDDNTNK